MDTMPQGPALVIDASSYKVEVAIFSAGATQWLSREQGSTTALESIHPLIQQCLAQSRLKLADISSWIVCNGPGAIIGLRLVGATLATWHQLPSLSSVPLYQYDSLCLAHLHLLENTALSPSTGWVVCAGRSGTWYGRSLATPFAARQAPVIMKSEELENLPQPLWQVRQRPSREPIAPAAQPLHTRLPDHPERLLTQGFLSMSKHFQLFDPLSPTYAQWSGERHRG